MDRLTDEEKTKIPTYNDSVGIRATLNSMGIPNNKIGYNEADKTVTINGRNFMKPSYMDEDNGISYAPVSDIRKNLVSFYKDSDNPLVRVSDAYSSMAGRYGLDGSALSFGDGTVMIGGKPLNTTYIDSDGKAWAWQNDVYNSVKDYASSVNVSNPNDIAERYNRYLDDIYDMINDISRRDKFSYDPEKDPIYQAYRRKYLQEGNRASRDTMAEYSTMTGGYVNSSAVTSAALSSQYYSQQLSNKIPELAEQAYNRYMDSYQTDLNIVSQMLSSYDKGFDNSMLANDKNRDYANDTAKSIRDRDISERELKWNELERTQEYETKDNNFFWTNILNQQKVTESQSKLQADKLKMDEQRMFLSYYRRILDAQLAESQAKVYSAYN